METRKLGTGRRERETGYLDEELDDTLVDDAPEDGFELLDEETSAPEDRRKDPLRRPA